MLFELEGMGTLAGVSPGLDLLFKLSPPNPGPMQKTLPGRMGGSSLGSLVVGVGFALLEICF